MMLFVNSRTYRYEVPVQLYEDQYLFTDRSIKVSQLLRSHFDGFVASFRTSAEDGDATASDTALPLAGVGGR